MSLSKTKNKYIYGHKSDRKYPLRQLISHHINYNSENYQQDKQTINQAEQMSHNNIEDDDDEDCWDDASEDPHQQLVSQPLDIRIDPLENQNNNFYYIDDKEDLRLHKAIFDNDAHRIYEILSSIQQQQQQHLSLNSSTSTSSSSSSRNPSTSATSSSNSDPCNNHQQKSFINKKDIHGNTALHLACILGRSKDIITALLQNGAAIDVKNLNRWTPFHEACSYGDREIITLITRQLKDDVYDAINKNKLSENLEKIKNLRLVLNWEFQSWVPFISRVLPSDVCVITKQDNYLRIDTRMLDFEMLSWKKGDSCLVYSNKFENKWIIMNNKSKKYQHFETQNVDRNLDEKVDEFMSTDIMDFELKSSDFQLTRSTSGWIWKADRMEKVGRYNASLYNFSNLFLVTRKRREHLKEEDLKRNKIAYKSFVDIFKHGIKPNSKVNNEISTQQQETNNNNGCKDDQKLSVTGQANPNQQDPSTPVIQHRESLRPPPPTNVTWEQYIQSKPGQFPNLGREQKCKMIHTPFKASVAMSEEFPITKNEFLDLLSVVPLKLFKKLKEFIEMRLPEGFPVRLDIPVFPFLTARITLEDFSFLDEPVDEALFSIPDDYEEDPNLFPFLGGGGAGVGTSGNTENCCKCAKKCKCCLETKGNSGSGRATTGSNGDDKNSRDA